MKRLVRPAAMKSTFRTAGRVLADGGRDSSLDPVRTSGSNQGERAAVAVHYLVGSRDRYVQVAYQSISQTIDPAMNGQCLPALPCVLDDRGSAGVSDLLDHVQLAQQV